jgi:hypothetical protein
LSADESHSFALSDIITVVVGPFNSPEAKKYQLHKSLLVSKSGFFRKCLGSGLNEQRSETVILHKDDSKSFSIIVDLLYTSQVPLGVETRTLMSAYVTADRLLMPRLQNMLMDKMSGRLCLDIGVNLEDVSWVWKNTAEGSKLREFMVDALHREIRSGDQYMRLECLGNCDNGEDGSNNDKASQLKTLMVENGALGYELYRKALDCTEDFTPSSPIYDHDETPYGKAHKYHVEDLEEH